MPQNPKPATPEEQLFEEWLVHPVTRRFRKRLEQARHERMEEWAAGVYTVDDHFQSAMLNAEGHAVCNFIKWLLDMEVHHLYDEEGDE